MRNLMRFTLLALAIAVAACEPHWNPAGGTAAPAPVTDERGVLLLDGLGNLGPQIQAAMGTAEERANRAPYSPVGWPLERGEVVSFGRYRELGKFGDWLGATAPFWVGKTVFGARWTFSHDDPGTGWYPNMEYIGHFPEKTKHEDWTYTMPDHLIPMSQTEEGFVEIAKSVFKLTGGSMEGIEEMKLIWTRERWLEGYTGEGDDQ